MADQPNAANQPPDTGMQGANVTTSIDDLVAYLKKQGETDSLTLAKELGVPETIVEAWANVLEKANIVKVNYKVGKMYLAPAIAKPEEEAAIKQSIEMKRQTYINEVSAQAEMIKEIGNRIDAFKKYIGEVEEVYKSRAGEIKEVMDKINAYGEQVSKLQGKLAEGKEYIEKYQSRLNAELSTIDAKAKLLESANTTVVSDSQKLIADLSSKLSYSIQTADAQLSAFEKQLEEERKKAIALHEDIRKEAKLLDSLINQLADQVDDYKKTYEEYSKDAEKVVKEVSEEKKRLVDEATKAAQQASSIYAVAQQDAGKLSAALSEIKSRFPEISDLSDRLALIKQDIGSMEQEQSKLAQEIAELREQLEALARLTEEQTAKKAEAISAIEKKLAGVRKRSGKVQEKTEEVDSNIKDLSSGAPSQPSKANAKNKGNKDEGDADKG